MSWQRWLRRFLDGLILLLVGWLLLSAAYVSLGRQFVPAVADYQAELVEWVEQQTGRAIELQSLEGEMQGAQPVFTLRGLRVHEAADPASPVLFDLQHVTARVDVFASLWHRQPVMDALQLEGLSLEVIEDADGHWRLEGLGQKETAGDGLDRALEQLFEQRRITLLDTRIRISPWAQPDWVFADGDLTLLNQGNRHRLDARVRLPDAQLVQLQLNGRMPNRDWRQTELDFFAALPASDWSDWLPAEVLRAARIERLVAGGELWGRWQDNRMQQLRGQLQAPAVELDLLRPAPAVQDLSMGFALQLSDEQQRLSIDDLRLRLDEHDWPATRLQLQRQPADGRWQARIDQLPLDLLGQWLGGVLPDEHSAEILDTLAPEGTLRNVSLSGGDGADFLDWSLLARLEKVGVQAWEGVPAFAGISGVVAGTPSAGELRVDSRDWSMHLPRLFPERWEYDSLVGALNWSWSNADGLHLEVPGAAVQGVQGNGAATLDLHLPRPGGTPTMDLRVALRDSRAEYHSDYLPTLSPAMNPELTEWLADSQLAGVVPLAIFAYEGSLLKAATSDERQISLFGRLEQGSLLFQEGWPALQQVDGSLYLNNADLTIDQARGQLLQTQLENIEVTLGRDAGENLELLIDGAFAGPLQDGLHLMQQTPLAELTGDPLHGWSGAGEVQGELQLGIPLGSGRVPRVLLQMQARAQQLDIPQLQAPLKDLTGNFRYEHGKGLLSEAVNARFLDQPVTGRLDLRGADQRLRVQGRHRVANLHDWPLLVALPEQLAEGSFDWHAELLLGEDLRRLLVRSDLKEVQLNLPGALAKAAGTSLPSELQLDMGSSLRWQWQLGDDLRGLLIDRDGAISGDIRYRQGLARLAAAPGVSVSARFDEFDWNQWQDWFSSGVLSQQVLPETPGQAGQGPTQWLNGVHVETGHFTGFGLELDNLAVSARPLEAGWELNTSHPDLQGRITLPAAKDGVITVDLQRLGFPKAKDLPATADGFIEPLASEDPLKNIAPANLPAMDIAIDQLYWGEDLVGATYFKLRPDATALAIRDIDVALRGGLQLNGNMHWNAQRTRFDGSLAAGDIGKVLSAWRYAPTLTSERFSATAGLEWPGSPAWFALKRSTGALALQAEDGTLQSGESSADALRVFGLLNFNALTRRLRLDFSDLFGKGTAYDTFKGELALTNGLMQTMSPLVMDGPSAKLQLDGTVDLPADRIDMGLLVTLPVTNNLPLAAIIAGAPHIGGVLFLVDRILGDRVARFASVKYRISGDWTQPSVEFDRAFDDKAALED